MNDKQILAFYGLKWNPFLSCIPAEGLWSPPGVDNFLFRLESMAMNGGFALVSGEPGLGKSKILQLIAHSFARREEVVVGVMERPQSSLGDFYREMGSLFGVNLTPANRYGGFKDLRARWHNHIKNTLYRPLLIIDEAQEMLTCSLNELRLLGSAHFDSQCLLTTVVCGDMRLAERFRSGPLVSLGSRMHHRMMLEPYGRQVLLDYLEHVLNAAGAQHLMTQALMEVLADHCAGNLRLLNNMAAELLLAGARAERPQLDEKLYLEVFSRKLPTPPKRPR
jgi:type II secretory pathway predicted ATPase ExeA